MSDSIETPGSDDQGKSSGSDAFKATDSKKSFGVKRLHKKLAKVVCERLKDHNFTAYCFKPAESKVETVITASPSEHVHAWVDFSDVQTANPTHVTRMEFILFMICSNHVYDVNRHLELLEFINIVNSECLWARIWLDKKCSMISFEYAVPFQAISSLCAGNIVEELNQEFIYWSDKAKMVDSGMTAQDAFDAP